MASCEPAAEIGQTACLNVSDLRMYLLLRIFHRHYMQQTSKGRPPMVRGGGQRSSVLGSEKIVVHFFVHTPENIPLGICMAPFPQLGFLNPAGTRDKMSLPVARMFNWGV